jgi:hypothetical protein
MCLWELDWESSIPGLVMMVILSSILMQHFEFRSFSRVLKGRTRTATFTASPSDMLPVPLQLCFAVPAQRRRLALAAPAIAM